MARRTDRDGNRPAAQDEMGFRDTKGERGGQQQGPQTHAEGAHGEKTHAALIAQLQSGSERVGQSQLGDAGPGEGEQRLVEGRQQHDEADRNSEKNRLTKRLDEQEGDRDGHQVPHGHKAHELPRGGMI